MATYRHILLVDDDEYDQVFFQTVAKSLSGDVKCTALCDADVALQKLQTKEIEPDIIFIESDLPAMNSKDFLAEVKKEDELKNIPVIIFTAHFDPLLVEETKALGADNFIIKPNRYSELKRILSTLILWFWWKMALYILCHMELTSIGKLCGIDGV